MLPTSRGDSTHSQLHPLTLYSDSLSFSKQFHSVNLGIELSSIFFSRTFLFPSAMDNTEDLMVKGKGIVSGRSLNFTTYTEASSTAVYSPTPAPPPLSPSRASARSFWNFFASVTRSVCPHPRLEYIFWNLCFSQWFPTQEWQALTPQRQSSDDICEEQKVLRCLLSFCPTHSAASGTSLKSCT